MEVSKSTIHAQRVTQPSSESVRPDFLKLGSDIVAKLHILMKMSRMYDSNNRALSQFVQESLNTINTLINSERAFSLKIIGNDLYLNDQRLRYSVEGFMSMKNLLTQLRKKVIGEVIFKGAVDERMFRTFIYALVDLEENREENAILLNKKMEQEGIPFIKVNPLEFFGREERGFTIREKSQRESAKKVFFETVRTVKEVISQIKGNQHADVRKLRRLVQRTIHLISEDESTLLGLTTIKNYDEYTFNHSCNVSIYSLAMGRRLGFSKHILAELGMTALLHDVGKSKIPKQILNKPTALDEEEWIVMKNHPLAGVETVLDLKELGEINPRIVIGIFEHHLKNDLSGYPKLYQKKKVSLFGRIIQITDAYDAMTTARIYKKIPARPEQALTIMLREKGDHFDPILLKIFIGLMGIYPIGSLVLLNDHTTGVVLKSNPDSGCIDRPQVLLLELNGTGNEKKRVVDLAETDENGHFKRNIIKTLDPNKYHVDIAKFFL